MSSLVLVRHAQASFFEDNYDRLSSTGEAQARCLGAHWIRQARRVDEIYYGPRVRHRTTAEIVGAAYDAAGLNWPAPTLLEALDEHAVDRILKESVPQLCRQHPHVGPLAKAYELAKIPEDRHCTFQKLFEAVVLLWSQGEEACVIPGVESWHVFRERVRGAIARIASGKEHGRSIAVFTSVGPISVSLQIALGCSDPTTLELGWRLRNASLTEFAFTRGRFTLDSFNAIPHLDDPALWTYR